MKTVRRSLIVSITLLCLSLILLSACSSKTYKNDVATADLTKIASDKFAIDGGYKTYDADFMKFYMESAVSLVDSSSVIYDPAADDYAEFGVFRVASPDDVATVEAAVTDYLAYFKTTYEPQAQQYDPSERQKLNDASVKVYGNYVVYAIHISDVFETWTAAVESALQK